MNEEQSRAPQTALVTGGSRGIGAACVHALMAQGIRTAAVATSIESAKKSGADVAIGADVSDKGQVKRAVEDAAAQLGSLDVLINNAGVAGANDFGPAVDDTTWMRIFDVNVHGTYYMCNAALAHLPDDVGRIINLGSVLSARGVPDQTAYCAAKHAVVGYTRSLALALAPRGITVNAVCPGWVQTDMAQQRAGELHLDTEALAKNVPLGAFLSPEEIAASVLWLISPSARNVTGQAIFLDGGVTA